MVLIALGLVTIDGRLLRRTNDRLTDFPISRPNFFHKCFDA